MYIEMKEKKSTYFVFRFQNKEEFEDYVNYILSMVVTLDESETYKKQADKLCILVDKARERLRETDDKRCAFALYGNEITTLFMCINCAQMEAESKHRMEYNRVVHAYSDLISKYASVIDMLPGSANVPKEVKEEVG